MTKAMLKAIYLEIADIYDKNKEEFIYFGCSKAPIKRLQNKFRYQVLMRTSMKDAAYRINAACAKYRNRNVTIGVELNPNNLI